MIIRVSRELGDLAVSIAMPAGDVPDSRLCPRPTGTNDGRTDGIAKRRKRSAARWTARSRSVSQTAEPGNHPRDPGEGRGRHLGRWREHAGYAETRLRVHKTTTDRGTRQELPDMAFTNPAHHIDIEWMLTAHGHTRKDGAVGVDGQTAEEYEVNLEANLQNLLDPAKSGTYVAPPVRRVHIPKAGSATETRPLGTPRLRIRSSSVRC